MSSLVVHAIALDDLPVLEPRAWRNWVKGELLQGSRPVMLWGRRSEAGVEVSIALQRADRGLDVLRTTVDPAHGYFALTEVAPSLHACERELHETLGVRLTGHPWLKPLRFHGQTQADMAAYPYYRVDGKCVHEVAVGPIHAGVIEPGSFRFQCSGELVHHLEIQLGYQHRGVEALLAARDPRRTIPLVETIAGDASVAHAWAACAALERLAGVEVPPAVELTRAILLELERVAMHLAGLAGMATDVGFVPAASTYGRLRTTAINTTMRLCGSRFGRGALRPGGVAVTPDAKAIAAAVELLTAHGATADACFFGARVVQHRLQGVGALTTAQAQQIGLVGLAARACGVELDQRQGAGGAYAARPIGVHTEPSGDCWARARVRSRELTASLAWLADAAGALAEAGPLPAPTPIGALAPSQLVIALAESWRGEVVHALETDAAGRVVRHKVQDPSLRNWLGLALSLRDNEISDFPICNKSYDLSYCGNDL